MRFNHSKLQGRIRECGFIQATLAEAIGISKGTLNAKLSGRFYFTTSEIVAICNVLSIPYKEIPNYFFAV